MTKVSLRRALGASTALIGVTLSPAWAGPQQGSVVTGSASIAQSGSTTTVTQGSDRAVVDWRGFSVGAGESVRFDQPGRGSIILNRVRGPDVSAIDGRISANGQVVLVNPNGIMVGPGGTIDVGGLVATTSDIRNDDFMAGRMRFDQASADRNARIVNRGTIRAAETGYAALSAAAVENSGTIEAKLGTIVLGGAKSFTLDLDGDRLLGYQITGAVDSAVGTAAALIDNSGTLSAAGGRVLMSARAAKGVIDKVINSTGIVQADAASIGDGGEIVIHGGDDGIVQVSGIVQAKGGTAGKGGTVQVLGDKVGLMDGAAVDVSGGTGGGTALIGGDWQGGGTAKTASVTYVAPTATVKANAGTTGNGGKAVIWADDTTRFHGRAEAKGGLRSGNGGKVETSGKKTLDMHGSVDAAATDGLAGQWLLDPSNVTIAAGTTANISGATPFTPTADSATIDPSVINTALDLGTSVTIVTTNGSGTQAGDILVHGNLAKTTGAATSLTLTADGGITLDPTYSISSSSGALTVNMTAASTILLNGNISSLGGDIVLAGTSNTGNGLKIAGTVNGGGGNIILSGTGGGGAAGILQSASGSILTSGAGGISMMGYRQASGASNNYGVYLQGTTSAVDGTITIHGNAGGTFTGSGNGGVRMDGAGQVSTSGIGGITVIGDAGAGTGGNNGIEMVGTGGLSATGTGAIGLTGSAAGTGSGSHGIYVTGGTIVSANSGFVTLQGTGSSASGAQSSMGINIDNAQVTGANGNVSLTGTGGSNGGSGNDGIKLLSSATVRTTGTGNLQVTGNGGDDGSGLFVYTGSTVTTQGSGTLTVTGHGNTTAVTGAGVFVHGAPANITTNSGDMTITGSNTGTGPAIATLNSNGFIASGTGNISLDGGTNLHGITLDQGGVAAAGGDVTVQSDILTFASGATLSTSGGGNLTVAPSTLGRDMFVGGTGAGLSLDPTAVTSNWNSMTFGASAGTGTVTVMSNLTAPANTSLTLRAGGTGGKVQLDADLTTSGSAGHLTLQAPSSVTLSGSRTISVGGNLQSSGIIFGTGLSLTGPGTDTVAGIAGTGTLTISKSAGTMTVTSDMSVGGLATSGAFNLDTQNVATTSIGITAANTGSLTVGGTMSSADTIVVSGASSATFSGLMSAPSTVDISAGTIALNGGMNAGATQLTGGITATGLAVSALTVSGSGAVMTGSVGGQTGSAAAIATSGPAAVATHTMNGCQLGVGCASMPVPDPVVAPPTVVVPPPVIVPPAVIPPQVVPPVVVAPPVVTPPPAAPPDGSGPDLEPSLPPGAATQVADLAPWLLAPPPVPNPPAASDLPSPEDVQQDRRIVLIPGLLDLEDRGGPSKGQMPGIRERFSIMGNPENW